MEFIEIEAIEEESMLLSSSDSQEGEGELEFADVIEDGDCTDNEVDFYRMVDNEKQYFKFANQSKNAMVELNKEYDHFFGENEDQHELFEPENPEKIELDNFKDSGMYSNMFYKTLNFTKNDKTFFNAIIYGVSYLTLKKTGDTNIEYSQMLDDNLRLKLIKNKPLLKLDH